jgi:hypothetical protein
LEVDKNKLTKDNFVNKIYFAIDAKYPKKNRKRSHIEGIILCTNRKFNE